MDRDGFWGLVEDARGGVDDTVADPDGVADALVKELGGLEAGEIAEFIDDCWRPRPAQRASRRAARR